ncbi:DUF6776 family protein [Bordetella sp. FB-8]|uniref:DUF6776 family protein n=1 Tax=Bordetella sp. FB-8 TaxID=1159870 RepID=UPI00036D6CA4|nr:DUF6776 family protein [Bordetella sp. FB-8]
MGIFGSSRENVFKSSPYASRRRARRMPRWLMLLLVGVALGVSGVLFLQHNYGPRQLTVEESNKLLSDLQAITLERQSLQTQLSHVRSERDRIQSSQKKASADLAQANGRIATLTQTLQILQDAVPADPRGGNIGVRWGEITAGNGVVNYRVLVMREQAGNAPAFQGQLAVELSGTRNGRADTFASPPLAFTLDRLAPLQGSISLPDGFVPQKATLRVSDAQGHAQAMRIYFVRSAPVRPGG